MMKKNNHWTKKAKEKDKPKIIIDLSNEIAEMLGNEEDDKILIIPPFWPCVDDDEDN